MKLKVAWVSFLGSAMFLAQSQGAASKSDGPPALPARPVPSKVSTPAKPKVAPEDEPVAEATAPAENTETTTEPAATEAPAESGNPYDIIIDRNIFRLNAQPIPPPPEPPKVDLPTIKISGFSESDGMTTAFFATVPKDPKEPVTYFALSDKVKQVGILELVKIHPGQDEVDVLINGTPTTLSVKSNSFVVAPPPPGPKGPGMPPGVPPGMNIPRNVPGAVVPAPGMTAAPTAPTAVIAGAAPVENSPNNYGGNYGGYPGVNNNNPGRGAISVGGGSTYPGATANPPAPTGNVNIPLVPQRPSRIPPSYPPEVPQTTLNRGNGPPSPGGNP